MYRKKRLCLQGALLTLRKLELQAVYIKRTVNNHHLNHLLLASIVDKFAENYL